MESETVKGRPLTKQETRVLLGLIEASKIIPCKTTKASNNKLKTEEWIRLTERFNSTADFPRTPQQLRLKWENLKKNARKRSTLIRMNGIKNGGGPPNYKPKDEILEKVSCLLNKTARGFTALFKGDKESADFVVGGDDDQSAISDGVDDDEINKTTVSMTKENSIETMVTDYQVLDVVTPNASKRLMSSIPSAVRKKCKHDENRTARNTAIADYYTLKKQCLDEKITNIKLENDCLKKKNAELNLNNEKLKLEIEILKLELKKSK